MLFALFSSWPCARQSRLLSSWLPLRRSMSEKVTSTDTSYFISPQALYALMKANSKPQCHILCSHLRRNTSDADAKALFERERLPGAKWFNIDDISLLSSPYPHTLPTPETFEIWMESFGIQRDDLVVVYEREGLFSAPRVLWTLHVSALSMRASSLSLSLSLVCSLPCPPSR